MPGRTTRFGVGKKAARVGSQPLTDSHVRCGACSRECTRLNTPRFTDVLGDCTHPSAGDHLAATAAHMLGGPARVFTPSGRARGKGINGGSPLR